ncbi:hypothetical protein AB1Y20_019050 [Prymnesium parvum]|uniref:Rab-GAP TBC domain-containing protein n=1 Tax=Prymnesium parvum TaxID=97485 RepID=A0AB34JT49_PRYPA
MPAGCVAPPGGWLCLRLLRCANIAPVNGTEEALSTIHAQCSCWLEGWPLLCRSTALAPCDSMGNALWPETLWLPLPDGKAARLCFELRLHVERRGCMPAISQGAHGVHRGYGSLDLPDAADSSAWCQLEGAGALRADGEAMGTAQLLVLCSRTGAAEPKAEKELQTTCDSYGFPLRVSPAAFSEFAKYYQLRAATQRRACAAAGCARPADLEGSAQIAPVYLGKAPCPPDRCAAVGFDREARPIAWLQLSGAERLRAEATQPFHALVEEQQENKARGAEYAAVERQVELDLTRTFPEHSAFKAEEGRRSLRRVLLAHALRNRRIGYTQSLNFIGAFLLLNMPSEGVVLRDGYRYTKEEGAFWLLCAFTELLLPEHFSAQMMGVRVDNLVLEELVEKHPTLHAVLQVLRDCGYELSLSSTQWFLLGFLTALPSETVARVWDLMFVHGPRVFFAAALATLHCVSHEVLTASGMEQVYMLFKQLHEATLDCDAFVRRTLAELKTISDERVATLRAAHRPAIELENQAREQAQDEYLRRKAEKDKAAAAPHRLLRKRWLLAASVVLVLAIAVSYGLHTGLVTTGAHQAPAPRRHFWQAGLLQVWRKVAARQRQ